MKTNNKLSAYILRGSTAALLFSCVIVALCSAINLPNNPAKVPAPQNNTAVSANAHQSRTLSFADRVAYQRAIEDVYWRHRIWPKERLDPKPSLDAVMSQAQLENKVADYLRKSQAVEDYWHRPVTAAQLQAEMDRMAKHTKQPEMLQELFEALGNDPFVIAECLARPALAERSLAHPRVNPVQRTSLNYCQVVTVTLGYALPTISDTPRGCIDNTWTATSTANAPEERDGHTAVWTGSEMIVWGGLDAFTALNTGGKYDPGTDTWTATSTTNAPSARVHHTAVWTGSEMIVWGGNTSSSDFDTGGRYNPGTDTWTATSTANAPSARESHTAVWTGSEMIVWGGLDYSVGYTNTGGRYNSGTDSWTATSTVNAPEGRYAHTAVWTGSEMIVWGGSNFPSPFFDTGGRYNPGTDSWTATSTINVPTARDLHTAVWTGSEMIVWGGEDENSISLNTGGRYNPGTNSWIATSATNAPAARTYHTAVWTNSEMIVWGGVDINTSEYFNTGGRYNRSTDSWTATSTVNAPTARWIHRAVWTGTEMIVWGGAHVSKELNTGGRYCVAAQSPTPTPTSTPRPAPTARPRPTPAPRP